MNQRSRKSVTQDHGAGCAVACTAYILGVTYQKALRFFSKPKQAWGRGFYCKEVVEALGSAQKTYSYCYLKPKMLGILKIPGTIVYVGASSRYPLGHYLVRTQRGDWMNPWINFPIITPAQSSFQRRLPGKPIYAIYPVLDGESGCTAQNVVVKKLAIKGRALRRSKLNG